MASEKMIERFSRYLRQLHEMSGYIYSHQLARMIGCTAAQVRRDLMMLGCTGNPAHGYAVEELRRHLEDSLYAPDGTTVGLIGVGNLGRAILSFTAGRTPKLTIVACFDKDPEKIGRVIGGCRCHAIADLAQVVAEHDIRVGIVTVPSAQAQDAADRLVEAGVRGLINFAVTPLRVPPEVFVKDIDITMSLEKVAHFAHQRLAREETRS